MTKEEIERLRLAFNQRDAAEKIINEARSKVPGRNKTHAIRKLLGLCPECGAGTPPDRHYCDKCRVIMNIRHRKK